MKIRHTLFALLVGFLILAILSRSQAIVNTRLIDEVLEKSVLDSTDLKIIDDFLADAVQDLVRTRDFTSVAKTRTIILTRQSTQAQYAQRFSEAAHKHISLGLQQAQELPEERRFKVVTNLLILIDALKDPGLIDLAISPFKDKNKAVRYWAVRAVTNPGLADRLKQDQPAYAQLESQITKQLTTVVNGSSPEVLALVADFAAKANTPEAQALLIQVADERIKNYAAWTVGYELADGALLKLLSDKITSTSPGKPDVSRRFAQLLSYVMQRYIGGQDVLPDTNKRYLASVLVETEDKCIGRLQGRPQVTMKRALEANDSSALQQEHDRLLGSPTNPGELLSRLSFDYGTNQTGGAITAPRTLPPPPLPEPTE